MEPKVVNVRTAAPGTYVYVGRAVPRKGFKASAFGNPFKAGMTVASIQEVFRRTNPAYEIKTDCFEAVIERQAAITLFTEWIQMQPDLLARVKSELRGKNLGCWCKEEGKEVACHADVLLEIANETTKEQS